MKDFLPQRHREHRVSQSVVSRRDTTNIFSVPLCALCVSVVNKTCFRLISIFAICLFLSGCMNLFFYPDRYMRLTPSDIGLEYEDLYLVNRDDLKLHGWFLKAENPKATVVFFHGNAQNISTHIGAVHWLPKQGFNVVLFDYRGFGKSEGKVSMPGVYHDVEDVLAYVLTRDDIDRESLIVFGQSIGGSLAIPAVARFLKDQQLCAVVIDSSFTGFRQIARDKLEELWLPRIFSHPLSMLFYGDNAAIDFVADITPTPILFMHGDADVVVPASHTEQLFGVAAGPKQRWVFTDSQHIQGLSEKANQQRLSDYLHKHCVK